MLAYGFADVLLMPAGDNDTGTPLTTSAIRVTLVVVEDIAERSERTIQRVIWIPAN